MSVQLNHTIIWCHDKQKSATFLTEILGLPAPKPFGPFLVVELSNGVSLDFYEIGGEIASQHYAFLIGEDDFDEIFGRIRERRLEHWADPGQHQPGKINRNDGGRGVYFEDPDGHLLEIITRNEWLRMGAVTTTWCAAPNWTTSAKLTTSGAFSERTGTQRTAVRGRAGLEKTAVRGPEPLPPLSRGLE